MPQYRCQINYHKPGEVSRANDVVNTFYLDTDVDLNVGEGDLIQDAVELFSSFRTLYFNTPQIDVEGKIYRMGGTPPNYPEASAKVTVGSGGEPGPREVALCLSYYAGQNVPRRRGRMYIGPYGKAAMGERPYEALATQLGTLAQGLADLGGVNVQWVQHSPTTGEFHNVTNWWVDDEWDTRRSRGLRAATRWGAAIEG